MSSLLPRSLRRASGALAVIGALAIGTVIGALDVVPVESQALSLQALEAPSTVPLDDPWDSVWDGAPSREVALSAQNIAPPFGGGTVQGLTARALHDGRQLYVLLEWADDAPNDAVNGFEDFSDAAAIQFPAAAADGLPPFTMGGPGSPVNIWQWKAVWQTDIDSGFATLQTRYPDTVTDGYQNEGDPLNRPAEFVGNPLAQRDHDSPVENLIAEGFGTLTHADTQDVAGSGAWRDGQWRALFARPFVPADDSLASFEVGTGTNVAFAVWDGGSDDRNGVKSIATYVELTIGEGAAAAVSDDDGFGGTQVLILGVIVAAILAAASVVMISRRQGQPAS